MLPWYMYFFHSLLQPIPFYDTIMLMKISNKLDAFFQRILVQATSSCLVCSNLALIFTDLHLNYDR